jgi:hypothetical protein
VREGFEPSVQFNPYGSLANYWFEPLTHLTVFLKKMAKISGKDKYANTIKFKIHSLWKRLE